MKKLLIIFTLLILPISSTYANSNIFLGFGGGLVITDDTADDEELDTGNIFIRAGLGLNRNIEVGGELSFTVIEETIDTAKVDLDIIFLFVKGNFPVTDKAKFYAMAGVTNVKLSSSLNSDTLDDNGIGLGLGVEFSLSESSAFTMDYISYYDDNKFDGINGDFSSESLNIGFRTNF